MRFLKDKPVEMGTFGQLPADNGVIEGRKEVIRDVTHDGELDGVGSLGDLLRRGRRRQPAVEPDLDVPAFMNEDGEEGGSAPEEAEHEKPSRRRSMILGGMASTSANVARQGAQAARRSPAFRRLAWLAGGSFALTAAVASIPAGSEPEKCDDMTHMSVGVGNWLGKAEGLGSTTRSILGGDLNTSWTQVAAGVTKERGFYVSPTSLAMANRKLRVDGTHVVNMETQTVPADTINIEGSAALCLTVPAPIIPGQAELNGEMSAADFMTQYGLDEDRFSRLNPNFSRDTDKTLRAGTRLNWEDFSRRVVGKFALQVVPQGGLKKVAKDTDVSQEQLAAVNWPFTLNGEAIKSGDAAYLPADAFTIDGKKVAYKALLAAYEKPARHK